MTDKGAGKPAAKRGARAISGLNGVCREIVYDHVFENADREVGGVLVGNIPDSGGAPRVTGAIEAFWADEQLATLTFTQEAWEDVHGVLDTDFPEGTQIVGWYHSHPGYGIFLSEPDLFIHQNFFASRSQIALVVDPVAGTEGVFAWHGDEVKKLYERPTPPAWVPNDSGGKAGPMRASGANVAPPVAPPHPPTRPAPARTVTTWLAAALIALIGAVAGFGIWSIVDDDSPSRDKGNAKQKQEKPRQQ